MCCSVLQTLILDSVTTPHILRYRSVCTGLLRCRPPGEYLFLSSTAWNFSWCSGRKEILIQISNTIRSWIYFRRGFFHYSRQYLIPNGIFILPTQKLVEPALCITNCVLCINAASDARQICDSYATENKVMGDKLEQSDACNPDGYKISASVRQKTVPFPVFLCHFCGNPVRGETLVASHSYGW